MQIFGTVLNLSQTKTAEKVIAKIQRGPDFMKHGV